MGVVVQQKCNIVKKLNSNKKTKINKQKQNKQKVSISDNVMLFLDSRLLENVLSQLAHKKYVGALIVVNRVR